MNWLVFVVVGVMWIVPESQAQMEKEKRKPMMDRPPYIWQPAGD